MLLTGRIPSLITRVKHRSMTGASFLAVEPFLEHPVFFFQLCD